MQNIVIDKPYEFVPPSPGEFWPRQLMRIMPRYLRRAHGVVAARFLGLERLRASVKAGHGILLTPHHCRPCDPMILFRLGRAAGKRLYMMASWHLFMQSRFQRWILRHMGVFSVYREGMDREALKYAVHALTEARRPLVLFPEGVISRTNDRLNHLMDGTVFVARHAAKQRAAASPPGKVVIHPVAIRYFFDGDVAAAVTPVLERIEQRLSWRPQTERSIEERVRKVGEALLTLKELECLDAPQPGDLAQRLARLIDRLLGPLEQEWLKGKPAGEDVIARVKGLRTAIVPEMAGGEVAEPERARRWRQLADLYLAQQLAGYPPGYFASGVTPEKLLETTERFEEDLTDAVTVHRPIRAVAGVGEPIAVNPTRERGAGGDPVMDEVHGQLERMLEGLRQYGGAPIR